MQRRSRCRGSGGEARAVVWIRRLPVRQGKVAADLNRCQIDAKYANLDETRAIVAADRCRGAHGAFVGR